MIGLGIGEALGASLGLSGLFGKGIKKLKDLVLKPKIESILTNSRNYNNETLKNAAAKSTNRLDEKERERIYAQAKEPESPSFVFPTRTKQVTSEFGWRTLPDGKGGRVKNYHNGTDYAGTCTEVACAVEKSLVLKVIVPDSRQPYRWEKVNGKWVEINPKAWTPSVTIEGFATKNRYLYMHGGSLVQVGQILELGEPVIRIDGYGNSFGSHLHLGMWEYLPLKNDYVLVDPHKTLSKYILRMKGVRV